MNGKNESASENAMPSPERAFVGFYVNREMRDALLKIGGEMGGLSLSGVARIAVTEYVKRKSVGQQ